MSYLKLGKNSSKAEILAELVKLEELHLKNFYKLIRQIEASVENVTSEQIRQLDNLYDTIQQIVTPINTANLEITAIFNKRVLLAETNKRQILIAKMALRGTGVYLDIVKTLEEGKQLLEENPYDIICSCTELIDLLEIANQHHPGIATVYITNDQVEEYLPYLFKYPFLSNIVTIQKDDRSNLSQNILSTISKILTRDLWGVEKYLHWGIDVRFHAVAGSEARADLLDELEAYMDNLGLRRSIKGRVISVTEEMLMNAIYDAPTDENGKAIYNHLPRTEVINLPRPQQPELTYACDGNLFAVSVSDPFGALKRDVVLKYLEHRYVGKNIAYEDKGGAGRGLYLIIETSDLVVVNVLEKIKTEMIAVVYLDPQYSHVDHSTSFHYFS